MPHSNHHKKSATPRDPSKTTAYLVGGGIASLAAAAHLIQSAHVPGNQIHILESGQLPGGSMDGGGSPETGYVLRGGRMLNFSYLCTYDLLSRIPSLGNAEKSVKEELDEFNALPENKTDAHARLVGRGKEGPFVVDVSHMGLSARQRVDLIRVATASEKHLGEKRIDECFDAEFFRTNFWFMWDTM
jgi:oleate hydratase